MNARIVTTNIPGITTSASVEVDWYQLGQTLGSLDSDQQGAFLDGLSAYLYALGSPKANYQIDYISTATHGRTGWFAERLHEALSQDEA